MRRPALAEQPRIAIVVSPRGWAEVLHRHVADHGGALVRARVLDVREALDEDYEVLVCEDLTSFLTPRVVDQVHQRGRRVLGLHDVADPAGERRLWELGVDAVLTTDSSPEQLLAQVAILAEAASTNLDEELRQLTGPPSQIQGTGGTAAPLIVVGGPAGGPGATEIAIAIAERSSRSQACALVDADTHAPAIAPRLDLPIEPSIRGVLERFEQGGSLVDQLHRLGRLNIVGGLADPRDWSELRPGSVVDLVRELRTGLGVVVADVGRSLEAAAGGTLVGPGRDGVARQLVGAATVVVAVGAATPVGVARLLDWFADVRSLTRAPVHVVINQAARRSFEFREVAREVQRALPAASVWAARTDAQVTSAAWQGRLVRRCGFRRDVEAIAAAMSRQDQAARA